MPKNGHRLARAMKPRTAQRDAAEKHAVVPGRHVLRVSPSSTHCGRTKNGARTHAGIAAEHPLNRVARERAEAVEDAALIAQVMAQAIRARSDGGRLAPKRSRGPFEEVGRPAVVGIEEGDKGHIADGGKTGISRSRCAAIGLPKQHGTQRAAVLPYPRVDAVGGAVRRSVVHDHDRLRRAGLRPDAVQATHYQSCAIPDGDDNANGKIRWAHRLANIGIA